jgi:hypothetical protein
VIQNSEECVMHDAIGKLAVEAGIACDKAHARSALPWQGILETAKESKVT